MTTNHPAHGHVSLDRLHQISEIFSKAAAQSDGGNLGYAMADAVKVIDGVIAAFGADPVISRDELLELIEGMEVSVDVSTCDSDAGHRYFGTVTEISELDTAKNGYILLVQDAKPNFNHTEQHLDMVGRSGDANQKVDFRLTFDQWLSQQNEPIDVDCGCVTTEAFYHWLRVAYEAGNSPVTQDTWIPISESMPEPGRWLALYGQRVFTHGSDKGKPFEEPCVDQGYLGSDGKFYLLNWDYPGDINDNYNNHLAIATHWMYWELPAAPQQEVKP